MTEKRKQDELGSAPTTPAPAGSLPHARTLAQGSDPDSTLDMPAADQVEAGDPRSIGHFRLHRRLGAGGMGVVYAGEDANLSRPVAIKLVRSDVDHPAFHARLLREAQAMARLEHRNVVKVYEVGEDAGRLFIAMELVEGVTLTTWLREPRSWRTCVEMFEQVGQGLAAVHRAGLVHRDFKPDNVLVDHDGHARVADFGLARLDVVDNSPLAAPLTKTGVMMGTPGFMAPEQQFGGDVDARADQYSFCVAMREALGGRPIDERRWRAVPKELRAIITRGLSYDPAERFASMDAVLAALARVRGTGKRSIVMLAALAVLVVAGGGIAYAILHRDEARQQIAQVPESSREIVQQAADRTKAIVDGVREANKAAILAAIADAGVPVVDAAVAPGGPAIKKTSGVPVSRPPRDAGADVVFAPPENDLTKDYKAIRTPASKVGDPAHLPLVRSVLHDIGYDGIDLAQLDRDPAAMQQALEDELAAQTGMDAGITEIKLGMVKRRQGDCKAAEDLWRTGKVAPSSPAPGPLWSGRSSLGFSICEVENGQSQDAYHVVMKAAVFAKSDEVELVMALIAYEIGETEEAHKRMIAVSKLKAPRVRAALKRWLDGTGLVL